MKWRRMSFPTKISPCPIAMVVAEIRFLPKIPDDAILGVVFGAFSESYPELIPLEVSKIPKEIVAADPNLFHAAHHQLLGDGFILQVGPRAFSLMVQGDYPGWTRFKAEILRVFWKFLDLPIVREKTRASLRYTDFFEGNIFDQIKMSFALGEDRMDQRETSFRTITEWENHSHILQIANSKKLNKGEDSRLGSIIDVDTLVFEPKIGSKSELEYLFDSIHLSGKKLFFSLLKDEFISTLNPVYDNSDN